MKSIQVCLVAGVVGMMFVGATVAFAAEQTKKEKTAEKAQREEQKASQDHGAGKISEKQLNEKREKAEKASREAEKERQERIGAK